MFQIWRPSWISGGYNENSPCLPIQIEKVGQNELVAKISEFCPASSPKSINRPYYVGLAVVVPVHVAQS